MKQRVINVHIEMLTLPNIQVSFSMILHMIKAVTFSRYFVLFCLLWRVVSLAIIPHFFISLLILPRSVYACLKSGAIKTLPVVAVGSCLFLLIFSFFFFSQMFDKCHVNLL